MNRAHKKWNYAADFAINLEIKDMGYALPSQVLYDTKYREMNAEQIYDLLPDDDNALSALGSQFDTHIDNSDENLVIDIDINLNLPPRYGFDEEQIIQETLDKTFIELEKTLKENFSS